MFIWVETMMETLPWGCFSGIYKGRCTTNTDSIVERFKHWPIVREIYFLFLSDEGPMLETLDHTIRIGSTPTFLYFDLYLHSAYASTLRLLFFRIWKAPKESSQAGSKTVESERKLP